MTAPSEEARALILESVAAGCSLAVACRGAGVKVDAVRYATNKEKHSAYREKNRVKRAQQSAAWREANPDRVKAAAEKRKLDGSIRAEHKRATKQERSKAARAAWRSKNRERLAVAIADWRKAHPPSETDKANEKARRAAAYAKDRDTAKKKAAAWKKANPERDRANKKAWLIAHPEQRRAAVHLYRARKKSTGATLTAAEWKATCATYANRCFSCGITCSAHVSKKAPNKLSMGHVVPLSRGGAHSKGNVAPQCLPCNMAQNSRLYPIEWRPGKVDQPQLMLVPREKVAK